MPMSLRGTVYADTSSLWRWRIKAQNGRILADSGESYVSRSNARRALTTFLNTIQHQGVEVKCSVEGVPDQVG